MFLVQYWGPFILMFKVSLRFCTLYKKHAQRGENCKGSEILTYLQSNALASHSLMDAGGRNKPPGSKTKHNLSLRAAAVISVCATFPGTGSYSVTSRGKWYFLWGTVCRDLQLRILRLLCSEVNLHRLHLQKISLSYRVVSRLAPLLGSVFQCCLHKHPWKSSSQHRRPIPQFIRFQKYSSCSSPTPHVDSYLFFFAFLRRSACPTSPPSPYSIPLWVYIVITDLTDNIHI